MQNFNPSIPVYGSDLDSDEIKDQLVSLDSCHSGASAPPFPQDGKFWYDTGDEILYQYRSGVWVVVGTKDNGFIITEYASDPVTPPSGFLWVQSKDASTKTIKYYDGTNTYSVDLST